MTGEAVEAMQAFLVRRATELGVPLDARDIEIRIFAGRLLVKLAWVAPVTLLDRIIPLTFSLEQDRKLPEEKTSPGRFDQGNSGGTPLQGRAGIVTCRAT